MVWGSDNVWRISICGWVFLFFNGCEFWSVVVLFSPALFDMLRRHSVCLLNISQCWNISVDGEGIVISCDCCRYVSMNLHFCMFWIFFSTYLSMGSWFWYCGREWKNFYMVNFQENCICERLRELFQNSGFGRFLSTQKYEHMHVNM